MSYVKVRIIQSGVPGCQVGQIVEMPRNRAMDYCRDKRAELVNGAVSNAGRPRNRMLDTRQGK